MITIREITISNCSDLLPPEYCSCLDLASTKNTSEPGFPTIKSLLSDGGDVCEFAVDVKSILRCECGLWLLDSSEVHVYSTVSKKRKQVMVVAWLLSRSFLC